MPGPVAKIASRMQAFGLKCTGSLPEMSWADVGSMLVTPNKTWPTQKLARPFEVDHGGVQFETPIGPIHWDLPNHRHLGLLVFEELCAIYEHGPVRIRRGDVVLDLGAHVGTFTRFALSRGASEVIAVEPEPSHVAHLRLTLKEEISCGSVRVVAAAVGAAEGTGRLHSDGVASRLTPEGSTAVRVTTVDVLVKELNLPCLNFIKADIEGAERQAIAGASHTISHLGPKLAVCTYHFPDDPRVIVEIVDSIRPYWAKLNASHEQAFFWPK